MGMSSDRYGKRRPNKSERRLLLEHNLPHVIEQRNKGALSDFQLGIFIRRCEDAGITRHDLREAGLTDA